MNQPSAFQLHNQTALITGGGTGLGLGMARCLVEAGAKVVLVGRRTSELERAAAEIESETTLRTRTSMRTHAHCAADDDDGYLPLNPEPSCHHYIRSL